MAMKRRRVAIIGAGASGVIAAAHLMLRNPAPQVILIGRDGFGPGLAYATRDRRHLLNVRACDMSAYAAAPDDFARRFGDSAGFATRGDYRAYLRHVLKRASRLSNPILRAAAPAIACAPGGAGWGVLLSSGRSIEADAVVFALGYQPAAPLPVFEKAGAPVLDPWDVASGKANPRGDVLLMGAGLTMIDVALSLAERGRVGAIFTLSRRGLVPRAHLDVLAPAPQQPMQLPPPLSEALLAFRREVDRMAACGEPWQLAVDRLRAGAPQLWRALSLEQQRRFLRHLRVWWDVHRHRAAPEIAARVKALVNAGKLRVLAGEVMTASRTRRGVELYHRQRGSYVRHRMEVAAVVNCTGGDPDLRRSGDPLIRQLFADGIARPCANGYGFDLDGEARLVGADGAAHADLFAIGPITQGAFWESTAIPEIRARAAAIAAHF
jgi:uncharacterized NAD(P)/FAD-binding protein YdhS